MPKTPRRAWPLWVLTNASLLAIPVLTDLWYSRVSREDFKPNDYSTGGDSFGLPLFSLTILLLLFVLLANIALRLILRPYPGGVDLMPRPRRSIWLVLLDLVVALLLAFCVYAIIGLVHEGDYEFLAVPVVWCYLLLATRATLFGRLAVKNP